MMLLDTLTIALLSVGILSSSIAQGRILKELKPKFPQPEFEDTSRSVDLYVGLLNPTNYVYLSREQCEENGGSTAWDELEASLEEFRANVENLVEPLRRETELALVPPRDRLPSVVNKYCRKVPTLKEYIKHVIESMKACMKIAGLHRALNERYFVDTFLNYICRDGGNGFATFIADGGMECLASKKQELLSCANRNLGRYLAGAEFVGDGVSELKGFEMVFDLDTKSCRDIRAFQSCMTDVLNNCENPTTAMVLNDFSDHLIMRLIFCEISTSSTEGNPPTIARDITGKNAGFGSFMLNKCEKNGGGSLAFDTINRGKDMIVQSSRMLDLPQLLNAIEYAELSSNSVLDSTLELYCRKVPIGIEILKFITDSLKSCLEPVEQFGVKIFQNVTNSLLKAACYNKGNAIAAFGAGDGVQCVMSKYRQLRSCAHEIFGSYFEAGGWKKRATPETPFAIDLKDCNDMERLRICVGEALAECEDKTAPYMVDSMFDTIHDGMSCDKIHGTKLRTEWSETEFLTERARQYLKDNCEKHAGPLAFEAVKEIPKYVTMGSALVTMNLEQLQADVTEAQLNGQVDLVSKKYCREIPALQKLIKHATKSVAPCFHQTPDEQTDIDFQSSMILSFLDFICDNEGERFTKLITSGGRDCLKSKRPALQQCIPDQYGDAVVGFANLREALKGKGCTTVNQTQQCFINVLNECEDPTAAQTVDDLINLLIKDTNCGPQVDASE